jgi:hypothetical protein
MVGLLGYFGFRIPDFSEKYSCEKRRDDDFLASKQQKV